MREGLLYELVMHTVTLLVPTYRFDSGGDSVPKHYGSDDFRYGPPNICSACFDEPRPSNPKHFYCEHSGVLAIDRGGAGERSA